MAEALTLVTDNASSVTANPFRRPNFRWIAYLWVGLFLFSCLIVGAAEHIRHSTPFLKLSGFTLFYNLGARSIATTIASLLMWALIIWWRSHRAIDLYRWETLKDANKPINWAHRAQSRHSQGHTYIGTRPRLMGESERNQVLSTTWVTHTLLLGDERVGWWERFFGPHLALSAEWKNTSIVIDPEATAERAERYGTLFAEECFDVQFFLPFEHQSNHLYLLEGARNLSVALELACIIIPADRKFAKDERALLAILIHALSVEGPVSLGGVYKLLVDHRQEVESLLLDCTEQAWDFDYVPDSVCDSLAAHLKPFDNTNLNRYSVPKDVHSGVNLGYGNDLTFVYAGVPANVPGRDILLRLTYRAIYRQLIASGKALKNPTIFMPHLEAYANVPYLATMLKNLRSSGVGVCCSLPSMQVGTKIYGCDFFQLKEEFEISLRFPRFANPSDIEPFRPSPANLQVSQRHTYVGDVWQRLRQRACIEPLLVPWYVRSSWRANTALLLHSEGLKKSPSNPAPQILCKSQQREEYLRVVCLPAVGVIRDL